MHTKVGKKPRFPLTMDSSQQPPNEPAAEAKSLPTEHANPLSLEGLHGSVEVPGYRTGFWRQWRAFVGPAILVSVGYMDPGNWGTSLAAGARFKYGLLWVVALASVMAILCKSSPRGWVWWREKIWHSAAAIGIRAGRAGRTGC